MWKAALSGVLLLLILGGCTAPKPTSGWVSRARVGGQYSDFIYRDGQGVERLLRNQLGDYTVLLFSRCDDRGLVCRHCASLHGIDRGQLRKQMTMASMDGIAGAVFSADKIIDY